MPVNINGTAHTPRLGDGTECNVYEYDGVDWNPIHTASPDFLSLGDDDNSDTTANEAGVYFLTGTAMDGVTVRLSQLVGDAAAWPDELLIKPELDGTVMTTVDISGNSPGDEVDIVPSGGLDSGSYYTVNLRQSDGSNYGRGRWESPTYPYSNEYFDVEGGIYSAGGSTTTNNRYNFSAIAPILP